MNKHFCALRFPCAKRFTNLGESLIIVYACCNLGALAQLVARLNGIQEASGSNPLCSTTSPRTSLSSQRLFSSPIQSHLHTLRRVSLSKKSHARVACSVINALTTATCSLPTFFEHAPGSYFKILYLLF